MSSNLRIAVLHPNLGIGGAEQLMVNLAIALQRKGHRMKIFTTAYNREHCFPETRDGTLDVEAHFAFIPFRIFRRFYLLMSTIKMILLTIWVLLFGGKFDVYLVDLNANVLPIIWLFRQKSIFYLHFPDKLLCQQRKGLLRRAYRFVMDSVEEISLAFASKILVNSKFTLNIFKESFALLKRMKKEAEVLYPAIDFGKFEAKGESKAKASQLIGSPKPFFLSLNRFERKKNVGLAISAFARMKARSPSADCLLVVAGGYDPECRENIEYELELKSQAKNEGVQSNVVFLRSVSHKNRLALLENCICVCYTPENEHFGIVPIEVMYMGKPVICHNSGGPTESVGADCGFLLDKSPKKWAEVMLSLHEDPEKTSEMGRNARRNVCRLFSFDQFMEQADRVAREASRQYRKLK